MGQIFKFLKTKLAANQILGELSWLISVSEFLCKLMIWTV